MTLIIFVPALLCIAALFAWGLPRAFRDVCLPVMLFLPTYFYWKTDGVPRLDFSSAVLLPLGAGIVVQAASRWRFSRSDLWVLVYVLSSAIADLRIGGTSLAKYRLFDCIVAAVIPYMAGKLLIEQSGARFQTVRKIALVLCFSCLLSVPEFFIRLNLFSRVGMHLFPTEWPGWWTQLRWGFGRVAGPYGTAEIYGLILIVALLLLLWLRTSSTSAEPFSRLRFVSSDRVLQLCLLLVTITLLMTQSRGPWLGALIATPIAFLGRVKHVKRAGLLLILVLATAAVPVYTSGERYVSQPTQDIGSEQQTAQYRRDLLRNYLPVAEKGGLWGWGTFHPILNGQPSIDNEFLRVFLVQGYVGLVSYALLFLEAGYCLIRLGLSTPPGPDRHFSFTMLGILIGFAVTLGTVYMGAQSYHLFFLLIGWTQAVPLLQKKVSRPAVSAVASLVPESSLTRVYT